MCSAGPGSLGTCCVLGLVLDHGDPHGACGVQMHTVFLPLPFSACCEGPGPAPSTVRPRPWGSGTHPDTGRMDKMLLPWGPCLTTCPGAVAASQ